MLRKYRQNIQQVQASLTQQMSRSVKFTEGLYKKDPTVKELVNSGGCVLLLGGEYINLGETPTQEEVVKMAEWLQKNSSDMVFQTDRLPELYSPAESFRHCGSGILAITISRVQQEYIIWFRPEQVRTIKWAGIPDKVERMVDGEVQLHPRNSFKAWSEQVRNTSESWKPLEVEAAKELRNTIVDLVLRLTGELKLRADILSRINHELNTDKSELDSFAYIASHDLKEPLRGIHQYAAFLLEDYGEQLDEEGQAKLQTLMRLSNRMQQLVHSLLQFSRMGRMELNPEPVFLKTVVKEVLDIFALQFKEEGVEVIVQEEWATISCDPLLVIEIFMNLISNALKYNDKENKRLEIGWRKAAVGEVAPNKIVCFVKDNGVGIDPKFQPEVFKIFRRLHARDAFGGGTGAGLTITKKVVERHGGQIWLDSEPGIGSTFYFSL